MKWCYSDGGFVVETTTIDPTGRYPDTQVWTACPDTVTQGFVANADGTFTAPAALPSATPSRIVSSLQFLALFTPAETTAVWNADPQLMTGALKVIAQGTANLDSPEAASLLNLAVSKNALSQAEATRILAGTSPAATSQGT